MNPHLRSLKVSAIAIALLIGWLPISMTTELRGASGVFFLLLALCLYVCFANQGGIRGTLSSLVPYKYLVWASLVTPFAVVLAMTASQTILGPDVERALRSLLGTIGILGACLSMRKTWLEQSVWGVMFAAVGATGSLIWMTWPTLSRPDMDQYTTVGYGNLLLLLSVISLFSMGWRLSRFFRIEQVFKIFAFSVGMFGFVITQSRSGWIAIPALFIIGIWLVYRYLKPIQLAILILVALSTLSAAFLSNSTMLERAKQVKKEFVECQSTNRLADTSVCTRLQLWRASWHMFKANPLLGNSGSKLFISELEKLHIKGIVSKTTKDEFGEAHNDFFYALASYGVLGFLGLVLVYATPMWIFAKRTSLHHSSSTRTAAAMGLAVCVGFVIFGLTEAMLRSMRMVGFYAVMVAWLLALSDVSPDNERT